MRTYEILTEVPIMVSQEKYPFETESIRLLQQATMRPDAHRTEYEKGDLRIASSRDEILFVFIKDTAVGVIELTGVSENIEDLIGRQAWQALNAYVLPEHRNKKLGVMLYQHVLHRRKEAFAAGAAMTPSSRRVYSSLLKDPTVDVYALYSEDPYGELERLELQMGPKGVTTGASEVDNDSIFVAIAK